eukprot:CAMPEP_0206018948 /NCGR_PEP_ID=MMETSP1464-20131121/28190_1 /ASSEMBLY_ACC=CAM_ASM_001124 /TAXON_ID=119497 /ORGANISM="Exanthemachrysis gayraliae, Strain RCC1523" /LENGTH=53 /DNA_ID=CAMNT_0053392839 /DNA_START=54 /DNA_END=215 /DNA_ORIENTATION=-
MTSRPLAAENPLPTPRGLCRERVRGLRLCKDDGDRFTARGGAGFVGGERSASE